MTRNEIEIFLRKLFRELYEIEDPGVDEDLREVHQFDSIDVIELLAAIEDQLGRELSQEEKKRVMDIRTLRQIIDYVVSLDTAQAAERDP